MIRFRTLLLAAALALPSAPLLADAGAPRDGRPSELSASERNSYREIFAAIRTRDWPGAAAKLDAMRDGPLHAVARAQLYLAAGSPRVELDPLMALLAKGPDLPEAAQLARLAATRGAVSLPDLPTEQKLVWQGGQPRRGRAETIKGDRLAAEVEALVQPLIVDDRPSEAEALFLAREVDLSSEARTQFQQRIGWSYYLIGDDVSARRLSEQARSGTGEWAVHGAWVAGLASWRMSDCEAASNAFATVASRASDVELAAGANYWAARADMMCGRPERVQARLRAAARAKETFYGLLAASALGIRAPNFTGLHDYRDAEWRSIASKPNVKAAIALVEIGESGLASDYIKHQARIGGAGDHDKLLHLACDLNLASTQFWLAHHAPRGADVNFAARYPRPDWRPLRGWRVDNSLVFAHALQESNFRTDVISPAGAQGLMQVLPGTAGDIARSRGEPFERRQLNDPAVNMEFGQSYLEYLRDNGGTGGLLPKVIAAYNAGPAPIAEWNSRRMDRGDPLLYIESIPYWETRGYVPIVLRNYWIYEEEAGKGSSSRIALAQGMWPRFPGLPGASAVRFQPDRSFALGVD
ncbi:lytic transglycosylase domain-containing protein [Sphingosinicella rhizophila]|uniref:Lytic transglycosylase domain-containing protein n=1 Tax=Sphingosinicella rhizophila TaxID=3050082 RepID=A0ABU3Q2B8_9SPHN|nr:lytic transglycosylase domain-containing protein [Sphingosinicella sp. GR2756]MDT9597524.1 lytic transglycosylase domain-containing protein [Sphingosinicella sp. GR2756]